MNSQLIAGGYIIQDQIRHQLPVFSNPSKADIHKLLTAVKDNYGLVSVKIRNEDETGIQNITLHTENQRYLISIYEIDEEGEPHVRLPIENSTNTGLATIHGESFPAAGITHDFQAVVKFFDEFIT